MNKLSIRDLSASDLQGKRVLVRVDFNVPMKDGVITDDTRIRAALPTLQYLSDHGAIVAIASHLGRPDGKVVEKSRLAPIARHLEGLIGKPVQALNESVGDFVKRAIEKSPPGSLLLLENIRFYPGEETNDPAFCEALADLADLYVNDAFGTAHRAHASTAGIAAHLPAYAGFLMEKEINVMGQALANPKRPFVAIIGGAKVSSKIGVLKHLLGVVDKLVIGGAMIFTFFKAQGRETGLSLVEPDLVDTAKELMSLAQSRGVEIVLPIDVIIAGSPDDPIARDTVSIADIPVDAMGVDIGSFSIEKMKQTLADAQTVVWNGPMGVFENPAFARGTEAIAELLADLTSAGTVTIVGGGDSVAAIEKLNLSDRFTHVSTGGGATLEFLEGIELPGVAALRDREVSHA